MIQLPQLIQENLHWYEWRIKVMKLHEDYYQTVTLVDESPHLRYATGNLILLDYDTGNRIVPNYAAGNVLKFNMISVICVICTENCNRRRCISFKRRSEYPPYLSQFAGQSRPLQMLPIRYFWSSGSDNIGGLLPKE